MAKYRDRLPQLEAGLFLTDGGLETSLVFLDGLALPDFAAFPLIASAEGEATLRRYFAPYAQIALQHGAGLILDTPTWRASSDWGARLGYDRGALARLNRQSVALIEAIRGEVETDRTRVVLNAIVGPRGDGYVPGFEMTEAAAEAYHAEQIDAFADSSADLISAMTLNYEAEAIGVARAARRARIPVAISFTVETDGRLPTGQPLHAAIERVEAETDRAPVYYGVNCAHPAHFQGVLGAAGTWRDRIRCVRANASRKSHAELNEATELDIGDIAELSEAYADLKRGIPQLSVLGGCCGTDSRHIARIAEACAPLFATAS